MAEPTSSKKTVSRRVLFSAGAGAGLCRLATARAEPEDAIDARDVANGLNCCLGAVDLILLLEIKPSLREVAETAREVLRFLPALTARTLALDTRGLSLTLSRDTQALLKATAASTTGSLTSLSGLTMKPPPTDPGVPPGPDTPPVAPPTPSLEPVRGLVPLLEEFLANGVADGQTAESIGLFVAKVLAVALLMNQTASSLVSLRVSLEGQGVRTPEFESFVTGKLNSWASISQFLESARRLETRHAAAQARAAETKADVEEIFKALTGPMPDVAAAQARSARLNARLSEVSPGIAPPLAEDRGPLDGARLLLSKMVDQVGRPEEDAALFASLEIEDGAVGLRARVVAALERASGGRSTWFQETVVVIAARTAGAAGDRDGRLNIVATAILAMVPRLPFRLRNFDRALQIAAEIV